MKYQLPICGFLAIALTAASAQMASHTPTAITNTASAQTSPLQVSDKPVARVNGAVLTDRDLLRETVQQSRPIPAILAERDAWFRATCAPADPAFSAD
jgi:hypothetical protein